MSAASSSFRKFQDKELAPGSAIWIRRVPHELMLSPEQFENLWALHPAEHLQIKMRGRLVGIPRWQQAYGADYHFSGQVSRALPIPPLLVPLLDWTRASIDERLNGILVNWYDGNLGHYIGPHRDSTTNMIRGAPIVTISFGESRVFRLRPWPRQSGSPIWDCPVENGSVIAMPFEVNRKFTHEIVRSRLASGKRISITLRAFEFKSASPNARAVSKSE